MRKVIKNSLMGLVSVVLACNGVGIVMLMAHKSPLPDNSLIMRLGTSNKSPVQSLDIRDGDQPILLSPAQIGVDRDGAILGAVAVSRL